MTSEDSGSVPRSAREILAHFLRHPHAADSLEGVARWRVQEEAIQHTVEQVGRALGWLVEQGFLVRESSVGVTPSFRLNRSKAADAERFLAGERTPRPMGGSQAPITTASASGPVVVRRPNDLMVQALAWVDATLLRYHRANPPSGGDLPGLTKSHASVESALAPRVLSSQRQDGPDSADEAARILEAACAHAEEAEPLAVLYRNLALTSLELQALLLCLAPEVDAKYQSIYGILNDDLGRRAMTLGLVCAMLGEPLAVRNELARSGGLTRWRLLDSGATFPYADQPLRLEPPIAAWLLGDEGALIGDPQLLHILRTDSWVGANCVRHGADISLVERASDLLSTGAATVDWIVLSGADVDGSRAVTEAAVREAGCPVIRMSLDSLAATDPANVAEIVARLRRVVRIGEAVPVLDTGSPKPEGADSSVIVTRLLAALGGTGRPGVLITPDVQRVVGALPGTRVVLLHRHPPDSAALAAALAAAAAEAGLDVSGSDVVRLAMVFPLPLGAMADAVRLALLNGAAVEAPPKRTQSLAAALRRVASPDLPRFARCVEPMFSLSDVVLPGDRRAELEEMVAHVRYAAQVLGTWGFSAQLPYGRGVAALFCGPSGTGKTMAAQAIARALETDAYVVDLSRVVSKYIGESEKNLDAVFNDAERAGAVLVFDEADALFGKRSEIKDAHDRYANIEVAYLLQRMEAFGGLAILTTNVRRNLDEAFLRRLRFVVEFPKPDPEAREAIWRQCLPAAAPLGHDINVRLLARRLELTGGNIRQITVRAAFAAAGDRSSSIEMRHVLAATRAELLKLGMHAAARELGELDLAERRRAASRVA